MQIDFQMTEILKFDCMATCVNVHTCMSHIRICNRCIAYVYSWSKPVCNPQWWDWGYSERLHATYVGPQHLLKKKKKKKTVYQPDPPKNIRIIGHTQKKYLHILAYKKNYPPPPHPPPLISFYKKKMVFIYFSWLHW